MDVENPVSVYNKIRVSMEISYGIEIWESVRFLVFFNPNLRFRFRFLVYNFFAKPQIVRFFQRIRFFKFQFEINVFQFKFQWEMFFQFRFGISVLNFGFRFGFLVSAASLQCIQFWS